jgi:hypothetical protein
MFVTAGLTFVTTLAFLVSVGVTAASLGASLWIVAPGVVSLMLALSRLGNGDPRGAVNLVLPVVVLILTRSWRRRRHGRPSIVRTTISPPALASAWRP